MEIPSSSKLSSWKYVEVARFVPSLNRVIRDKVWKKDLPILLEWGHEVEKYRQKYNNVGIYTSVFHCDTKDLNRATRLGSLYFDFDSENEVEKALKDSQRLVRYLGEHVPVESLRVYFTGSKGFHIEVEAIALGISPSNELPYIYRFMAEQLAQDLRLETIDFSVYDPRRMWRLPNSKHQKTDLYKVELDAKTFFSNVENIVRFASIDPASYVQELPSSFTFNASANEWYKNWVSAREIKLEEEKVKAAARRAELFNKYGTSLVEGHSNKFIQIVWKSALEALRSAKERNNTLSTQAYKLYLVLLESNRDTEEATRVLHEVALEIGLEDGETKATLRSALRAAEQKFQTDPRSK